MDESPFTRGDLLSRPAFLGGQAARRYHIGPGRGDLDPAAIPVENCRETAVDSRGRVFLQTLRHSREIGVHGADDDYQLNTAVAPNRDIYVADVYGREA